jgi:hypothetical protein
MKKLFCGIALSSLLAGCAHYSGGTGSSSDVSTGSGSSVNDRPHVVNDMDDLGYTPTDNLQRANGQPRFPGHSIDVDPGHR